MSQRRFDRGSVLEVVPVDGPGFRAEYGQDKGLAMSFSVKRTSSPEANTCTATIFNLNERNRLALTGQIRRKIDLTISLSDGFTIPLVAGNPTAEVTAAANQIAYLKLSAGYGVEVQQIFEGSSHRIDVRHEDVDWLTTLEAGDGELGLRSGVITESFGPGTFLFPVVRKLVRTMGVFEGNLTEDSLASAAGEHVDFPFGFTAIGRASDVLRELLALLEVRYSIQDGEFLILDRDGALPDPPLVLVGPELLSKPRRLEGDAAEIHVHMEPKLKPGRKVVVEALGLTGNFVCDQVTHVGDTHGDVWDSVAELRDISLVPGIV